MQVHLNLTQRPASMCNLCDETRNLAIDEQSFATLKTLRYSWNLKLHISELKRARVKLLKRLFQF